MRFRFQRRTEWVVSATLLSLFISLVAFIPVSATGGSLQLSLQGYGTVTGELQNTIIQSNNSVSMIMVVNDQVQTSLGPVQITTNGTWTGVRNGSALSGQIRGIVGRAQVCILICVSADFVGQGHWNGSLSGSHGTGAFQGTMTFTNSPIPQIQTGQPYLMSGIWSADFDLAVPEFGSQTPTSIIMVFALASLLFISTHRPKSSSPLDDL